MAISISASAVGANVGFDYVSTREQGNCAAVDLQAQASDSVKAANLASALDALLREPTTLDRLVSAPTLAVGAPDA